MNKFIFIISCFLMILLWKHMQMRTAWYYDPVKWEICQMTSLTLPSLHLYISVRLSFLFSPHLLFLLLSLLNLLFFFSFLFFSYTLTQTFLLRHFGLNNAHHFIIIMHFEEMSLLFILLILLYFFAAAAAVVCQDGENLAIVSFLVGFLCCGCWCNWDWSLKCFL